MTSVFDEWADGWHRAKTDDENGVGGQPRADWPEDVQRGYRDWWTHPQGHEKRVLEVDHRHHQGEALRPDPPLRPRGLL